jgi:glycerol-3-phosphate acyltransferase PlsY
MIWFKYLLIAVISYFLGNLSFGVIVSKCLAHTDIRQHGSGNAGATNMMRTLGWVPSVLTLVGDVLKALLAVVIGKAILPGEVGWKIAGIAVLAGHNWPALLHFKGGKGMASSLGILLATEPLIALALFVLQVIVLLVSQYMSLASLSTAFIYPIIIICMYPQDAGYIIFALLASGMAIFCHRANIRRLLNHTEHKLNLSKIKKFKKADDSSK